MRTKEHQNNDKYVKVANIFLHSKGHVNVLVRSQNARVTDFKGRNKNPNGIESEKLSFFTTTNLFDFFLHYNNALDYQLQP